ncbi:MAG TPA: helix-turn-helix domain-containing protein, partial [Candidatus Angelobacter sp.]
MPLLNIEPKHPGNPSGTPRSLIRDPNERKRIRILKQTKVLHWLKTEIYSSPEILALVLGFTHRQSVHKTLAAMEEYGLIRQGRVAIVGGHQTLWGITEHGQAMAFDEGKDDAPSDKTFEPGRISALRLRHILELQKLKWQAMQAGWTGWKYLQQDASPVYPVSPHSAAGSRGLYPSASSTTPNYDAD